MAIEGGGAAPPAWEAVPRQLALIGLGGNLGDVRACLCAALQGLHALPGTEVVGVSALYSTRPVEASGPDFLNAVAALRSALGPLELLHALQALEHRHERERPYQNAPRTLDLDLLSYGGLHRGDPVLTLPHPRMGARAFVLVPLAELLAGGLAGLRDHGEPDPDPDLVLPDAATLAQMGRAQGIERLDDPAWSWPPKA